MKTLNEKFNLSLKSHNNAQVRIVKEILKHEDVMSKDEMVTCIEMILQDLKSSKYWSDFKENHVNFK